ncbi:MAG: asparagine synthase (glutamine-hydrolyzing) [Chitinophagaceae bacterium]
MCGINGIMGKLDKNKLSDSLCLMNRSLKHRGPDDSGIFVEEGIGLGHQRLSIIDLSPAGHQPMFSNDGNLVIIFNGEIYNYLELRYKLTDYTFQSDTDTEVILATYQKWGSNCLSYLNGMFAFAIWDIRKEELFIARDRLGVKPLYYYFEDGVLAFSSEIRALLKTGLFKPALKYSSIRDYLSYQTVYAPQTILEKVNVLMPGHYIQTRANYFNMAAYWKMDNDQIPHIEEVSYEKTCQNIYKLLLESIERRMISDVPLAAFLSGGIDSSAVVALMNEVNPGRVKTFTITFGEEAFNEGKFASIVARKFSTDHHEIHLSPKIFLDTLPAALKAMDHPSGDGANSYMVSKSTKENGITVALTGLGGDELFAGYPIFKQARKIEYPGLINSIPRILRKNMGDAYSTIRPGLGSQKLSAILKQKKIALNNSYSFYRRIFFDDEIDMLLTFPDSYELKPVSPLIYLHQHFPYHSRISVMEMESYMQNVLLRDIDQMSMAHALEVREPFLDYKLVEYMLRVKDEYKYQRVNKKLLVDSLKGLLPAEIYNRKKMGFSFPWKLWLQNELRSFCEVKLASLEAREIFNKTEIQSLQKKFFKDDPSIHWMKIWLLVVLENWLEQNLKD